MTSVRIAVDMDEVIADALKGMRSWLKATYRQEWDDAELRGIAMRDLLSRERFAALRAHMHEGEFFGGLDVVDGAQRALRSLAQRHEVYITTAAMEFPNSLQFKWTWLRRHFDFLDPMHFVFCGDKSIIRADVLIDDNVRHFPRFAGQGIIFDAPHNAGIVGYPRLAKWANVDELLDGLLTT